MSRKAQATMFIVLGLIVLFSILLFIQYRSAIVKLRSAPEEINPLQRYVEDCMDSVARKGISLLSNQGGYIYLPLSIESDASRYYSPDGQGILKIPLWFYKGERYNPSVEDVEAGLSRYIDENIGSCLGDFSLFADKYNIITKEKRVQVSLNKADISILLDYPMEIISLSNESRTMISRFQKTVPGKVRHLMDIAEYLMESEVRGAFLENFTINLMAANPAIPFTDMKFTCERLEWPLAKVQSDVAEMLTVNLPRIRVKNTVHEPFLAPVSTYEGLRKYGIDDIWEGNIPDAPDDSYEYFHMYWDIGLPQQENVTLFLQLTPQQTMDFIGRPNDNGVLKAKRAQGARQYLSFLCINLYHFVYDINYPVIVTVQEAEDSFTFALPVTIRNNEPYKESYGYEIFTTPSFDQGFCENRGGQLYEIRAYGKEQGYSNIELNEVNISLECFKYYCPLGQTAATDGAYKLVTNLPAACSNPFITAEKEGYIKSKIQMEGDSLSIQMTRLKELPFTVVVHRYNSLAKVLDAASPLAEGMNVSLQILHDGLDQYKEYSGSGNQSQDMQLIDDESVYDIDFMLVDGGEYVGGYKGKWKVSASEIAGAEKVAFHVIQYVPAPFTDKEKMEMVGYILGGSYADSLEPELT